jgi:hypothetical protein
MQCVQLSLVSAGYREQRHQIKWDLERFLLGVEVTLGDGGTSEDI